ncbi:MAG TPA: tryptophan halogenase family protein, partial [Humisphaera sp.]
IRSVIILGGGSAGFLAAVTLRAKIPDLPVVVVRSKDIGIIGVGEGTLVSFVTHLHGYVGLDPATFYREADPVWKLGVRYLWGRRPWFDYVFGYQLDSRYAALRKHTGFYVDDAPDAFADVGITTGLMSRNRAFLRAPDGGPVVPRDHAYHLENEKFVAYLERQAARLGVGVVDATVTEVRQDDRGVTGLVLGDGTVATADLYIDCSGFRSALLGKALGEPFVSFKSSLFCDRAVVGGWDRPDTAAEPIQPYTVAETMDAGWCWRIDHVHRVNRGYVYSSAFLTDEQAEAEFRRKNPKVGPTRVVRFVTGRYERAWVKNVLALGNANGFVEPLQATSLAATCTAAQNLTELLLDADRNPTPTMVGLFNRRNAEDWDAIRRFLAVHYRFNGRLDTPFWQACRETVDLAGAEPVVAFYRENGPTPIWGSTLLPHRDQFGPEGYLSLLLGQGVPHSRAYGPTPAEREAWGTIRRAVGAKAAAGLTVEEALARVRSPGWRWDPALYRA